jgi:hypothetical protein
VIPKFLKYNPPESPSVVTAWNQAGDLIPECRLKDELIENIRSFLKGYDKPSFLESFKLMPNSDQNDKQTEVQTVSQTGGQIAPQQEQEQEQEKKYPPTPQRGKARLSLSPDDLGSLWNEKAPPGLSRVLLPFQEKRAKKIRPAIRAHPNISWWGNLFESSQLKDSDFLMGRKGDWAGASFDFVISHWAEILEGKYRNGNQGGKTHADPKTGKFAGIGERITTG